MKRRKRELTIAAILALLLTGGGAAGQSQIQEHPEIVVVTHPSIPLDSVSRSELSQVFLGLRTSIGDVRLHPIDLGAADLRASFLERVTGMSRARIEEHYIALALRGEGRRPMEVAGPGDVPRLAFELKRIVGWLTSEQYETMTPAQQGLLRILAVDGRKPGDSGYLLRAR